MASEKLYRNTLPDLTFANLLLIALRQDGCRITSFWHFMVFEAPLENEHGSFTLPYFLASLAKKICTWEHFRRQRIKDYEVNLWTPFVVCISDVTKWKEEKLFPKVLELERIILIQRMEAKNQPNKQHNKRPDAGRPTVKEMYWAEELIPKSVHLRNFEKEIPKPQCWRPYIAKSQEWKAETNKLTFQTWSVSGPAKRVSSEWGAPEKRERLKKSCHSFWGESSNHHHPKWVTSKSLLSDTTRAKTSSTGAVEKPTMPFEMPVTG